MKHRKLIALTGLMIATGGAGASEISLTVGQVATDSDSIPYVFDNNTNAVIASDLGDGAVYGLDFSTDLFGLKLGVGLASTAPEGRGSYDSNVLATNDCNVNPVQGRVSDCYDNSSISIDTTTQTFDVTVGKEFSLGWGALTPYAGIRQLSYDQSMKGAYNYTGGWETTWKRSVTLDGIGPRLGAKLNVPMGSGGFFMDGDLAFTKIMGSSRDQQVVEIETANGVYANTYVAAESRDVEPTIMDLALMAGYKIGSMASVGVGYRYQKITGVIDSRETNLGGYAPTYGTAEGDLEQSGVFAKATISF